MARATAGKTAGTAGTAGREGTPTGADTAGAATGGATPDGGTKPGDPGGGARSHAPGTDAPDTGTPSTDSPGTDAPGTDTPGGGIRLPRRVAGSPGAALVAWLAAELGEAEPGPLGHLGRVAGVLGEERARAVRRAVAAMQEAGGLRVATGERERTPGGVFFQLAALVLDDKECRAAGLLRPLPWARQARSLAVKSMRAQERAAQADLGEVRLPRPQEKPKGAVAKLSIAGRPEAARLRGAWARISLQTRPPGPLPRGLPAPQGRPPICTVLIARKHWDLIRPALEDPEDVLMAEGYPSLDPDGTLVLHAVAATTRGIVRATRAGLRALAAGPGTGEGGTK